MISVAAFQNRARPWLSENAARFAGFDPADPQAGRAFRSALWDAGLLGITLDPAYGGQGLTGDQATR